MTGAGYRFPAREPVRRAIAPDSENDRVEGDEGAGGQQSSPEEWLLGLPGCGEVGRPRLAAGFRWGTATHVSWSSGTRPGSPWATPSSLTRRGYVAPKS